MNKILSYIFIVSIYLLHTGCTVRNTFNPPMGLTPNDDIKRLVIFRTGIIDFYDPSKVWEGDYALLGVISGTHKKINFRVHSNIYPTYTFEADKNDPISIRFIMSKRRSYYGAKIFTDTTIHFNDLQIGNNYLNLNHYSIRKKDTGFIPVIELNPIGLESDWFKTPRKISFKQVLRYNISTDSIFYERKKAILSKQKRMSRMYNKITNDYITVDSLISKKQLR